MNPQDFCIVLTTTQRAENAQELIQSLLDKKLAACIQTMPIESHYVWQGEICHDNEILMVIKTQRECYVDVEQAITAQHDYDVPQIIQVPFTEGFHPYLAWIKQNTQAH
ncbi:MULTISPECIES: divalent-cation tolerance protein CutA [Vibrio]|uniref:Divalent cation tolerance protein CutA n=2 Tax=Vibrio TaxID=662 RepID=A0A7X4LNB4_9VIBR|nr:MULTISPECIES: divalent-cation tolerance protein CutA [Vibrio]MBF9003079.1 divalent-cation tolerance protein CutA [Vibrio nitrifigilis]MZI95160.1 divalent cation tolerance protein CutA [Vibrio eleionomae]